MFICTNFGCYVSTNADYNMLDIDSLIVEKMSGEDILFLSSNDIIKVQNINKCWVKDTNMFDKNRYYKIFCGLELQLHFTVDNLYVWYNDTAYRFDIYYGSIRYAYIYKRNDWYYEIILCFGDLTRSLLISEHELVSEERSIIKKGVSRNQFIKDLLFE